MPDKDQGCILLKTMVYYNFFSMNWLFSFIL